MTNNELKKWAETEMEWARNTIFAQFRDAQVESMESAQSGEARIVFRVPGGYDEAIIRQILQRWQAATNVVTEREGNQVIVRCVFPARSD